MQTPPTSNVSSPRHQEFTQLPIPKNLVLISLLEAAQHTEKRQDCEDNDEEEGGEQIIAGMNLLSSDFGTYVVREKDGLVVQPLSPSSSRDDSERSKEEEQAASEMPVTPPNLFVKTREVSEQEGEFVSAYDFQEDDPIGVNVIASTSTLEAPSFDENRSDEIRPVFRAAESSERQGDKPFMLRYGQTVQVVSFTNGVAMLARKNGYIEASEKQLVKGKPVGQLRLFYTLLFDRLTISSYLLSRKSC